MKTIPPPCPEPESGQRYWRSLDDLAETPEFRRWVEREFPAGASEFTDPIGRRHFMKIMSASFLLAGLGLTGCRRPEEKILPFGKQPEGYIHGVPQFYATAMPTRATALPLLVKSHDGRPTKIEGNPDHPDSNGATDTFAQASILSLYDPDRAREFRKNGNTVSREEALDFLGQAGRSAGQGQGLCFLLEQSSSPSRQRLQEAIARKFAQARWFVFEPVDLQFGAVTAASASGKPLVPYYKMDQAKRILALDCDFIGEEEDTYRHCRNYAKGRRIQNPADAAALNRLYAVEGLMTLTGMQADHRLRVPTSSVIAVAAAVAAQIAPDNAAVKGVAEKYPLPQSVKPEWITECAKDLAENKGASLVLAGYRQPPAVHALAAAMNTALGNNGKTVVYREGTPQLGKLGDLVSLLNGGSVNTLVILGGNPVYTAPADFNWAEAQTKAKTVIRLGYYEDETFPLCTWHYPQAHYLESWGDARTSDGTLVPIQPLIAPLFNGITELEMLARLGGLEVTVPHDIVRETFKSFASRGNFEETWKKFLHDGFLPNTNYKTAELTAGNLTAILNAAPAPSTPSRDNLEVVFHRDYKLDDGRWSNNGWLQELPDPISKTVWDGMVLISRKTAEEFGVGNRKELGIGNGDESVEVVEIDLGGRKIRGPVWVQPGLADYTVALSLGYGRRRNEKGGAGRVAHDVGLYNAYALRTSAAEHFASGAKLRRTGQKYDIACTQEHGSMEGRPVVREANAEQFQKFPNFAKNMDLEAPSHAAHIPPDESGRPRMIYEHPYHGYERRGSQVGVDLTQQLFKSDVHQWGMSIDLSTCVGCTACVLACQAENNVPIVGKDQVRRNREMHWLRIDRYWSGASDRARRDKKELIDDPQAVTQPMLCQHCENAPCESVCPVNATVHDEEGLNVMAYNRCVGTRYCSNNCPYKVRRFNFFDYNKHPLNSDLYNSPLTSSAKGRWNLLNWLREPSLHHTVAEDQWDILQLAKNPDVSVRMRGVMEKCTWCVQRIEGAKIAQKVKAGASGAVAVPEGTIKTACQQACPTEAIVFGNLLDPNSKVSKLKKLHHDYTVLGFLDTRTRLTYLARIRNPNPKMPDFHDMPLNIKEYTDPQEGAPFKEHHDATHTHAETRKGAAH
ncbi:MAG: TAT-variant-translocated molybdopterin oxidoreductase [Verrucomicrobia subdivision 3 bacterium]|nr:TAT-variant-translocated molybdopterin oxidoreductase [Limisphaerales bacterium]